MRSEVVTDLNLHSVSFASGTKGKPGGLPVPTKRTASGTFKGPAPVEKEQHIEGTLLPPGSPMKLSSPAKSAKSSAGNVIMTEDAVRAMQTGAGQPLPEKTLAKSRIPVKPTSSPSPTKLARTISRFSSHTDRKSLYCFQLL